MTLRPPLHGHGQAHANPGRRPTIGITPDTSVRNDFPYYDLKAAYADATFKAGGLPFVLTYAEDPSAVDAYLERISGLVITGGAFDIPPEAYGDVPREGLGTLKFARTNFETHL